MIGLAIPSIPSAFAVFIIRQFLESMPHELIEAGEIDGAGHLKIFLRVVLPLMATPLLTVTVSTDTQDFSARFYQDSKNGKYAYVVAGADKARCLKTDAWRVGTLLLTCEGTRIFDASGQETPVD